MTAAGSTHAARAALRAVIFDMDGVLIDSEPVWRSVEIDVFGSLGVGMTEADCRQTMGLRVREAVQHWQRNRPWTGASVDEVTGRIVAGVIERLRTDGVAMEGVYSAVAAVRRAGLLCAVASSSPAAMISAVVERLGIGADVDVVSSADDDARGKPAPDIYLRTAALLGVRAGCLPGRRGLRQRCAVSARRRDAVRGHSGRGHGERSAAARRDRASALTARARRCAAR